MSAPILATKLYLPPPRPGVVRRPRLLERLDAGRQGRLTLVSAPAGFGKTTLLSEWVAGSGAVAWLSLDENDNDVSRFVAYLVAALQTMQPHLGAAVLTALQTSPPPPMESLLTLLLNDLAAMPDAGILVLDDYHVIDASAVDDALAFLLEHLPPQLHVVIATREDPPLPLPRWRARGQLTELRIKDLRFTPAESADFLNQMMGLNLSAAAITALDTRTEGWIAGLQLAALSMQGHDDTAGFIRAFTGSHRFVLDYLVEEVLQRQPAPVRDFLLRTSILDRLCGPLCAAVTGAADSRETLETLERGNLFIVPLDDTRQWYRYHHLFADALQAHLLNEQPDTVTELHQRACAWYQQHDLPPAAIQHALAAADYTSAADLIEQVWPTMDQNYESQLWVSWVRALPAAIIQTRPILSLGYAWALLNQGDLDAAEAHLRDAERWLQTGADEREQMVVLDAELFRSLPAAIMAARAYGALTQGDITTAQTYTRQVLAMGLPVESPGYRQATALTAIAYWASGDLAAADRALTDFMERMFGLGILTDATGLPFILTDIRLAQGRLRDAFAVCEYVLQQVAAHDGPAPLGTADVYVSLAQLYLERNDLAAATEHLQTGARLGPQQGLPNWRYRLCRVQAYRHVIVGDYDAALAQLTDAAADFTPTPLPDVRPVAAQAARIHVRQGRLEAARDWAQQHDLTVDGEISYRREYEYITLARLLLARQHDTADAERLLERLLAAAQAGQRRGSVIEIRALLALALAARGATGAAWDQLQAALDLAEPEGYVRIFADEGPPMADLLQAVSAAGRATPYVQRLLAACVPPHAPPTETTPDDSALIEPLSARELDVLRLLATDLTGPEIADELMVSLNTLRTHTKNIYTKLGVNSRRAAVRRAEALDLH